MCCHRNPDLQKGIDELKRTGGVLKETCARCCCSVREHVTRPRLTRSTLMQEQVGL